MPRLPSPCTGTGVTGQNKASEATLVLQRRQAPFPADRMDPLEVSSVLRAGLAWPL